MPHSCLHRSFLAACPAPVLLLPRTGTPRCAAAAAVPRGCDGATRRAGGCALGVSRGPAADGQVYELRPDRSSRGKRSGLVVGVTGAHPLPCADEQFAAECWLPDPEGPCGLRAPSATKKGMLPPCNYPPMQAALLDCIPPPSDRPCKTRGGGLRRQSSGRPPVWP